MQLHCLLSAGTAGQAHLLLNPFSRQGSCSYQLGRSAPGPVTSGAGHRTATARQSPGEPSQLPPAPAGVRHHRATSSRRVRQRVPPEVGWLLGFYVVATSKVIYQDGYRLAGWLLEFDILTTAKVIYQDGYRPTCWLVVGIWCPGNI